MEFCRFAGGFGLTPMVLVVLTSRRTAPRELAQLLEDILDWEACEAGWVAQDNDACAGRTPDFFDGVRPQDQPGQTDRGSQMRNAGVVANERIAPGQLAGQFGERQALRDATTRGGQGGGKPLQTFAFGFAANQEQAEVGEVDEVLEQFGPVGFRPVLAVAAAAGMKGEEGEG